MLLVLVACQHPTTPPSGPARNAPPLLPLMQADDPILGDPYAPITLMEFSDFQCPFCQRFFPQLTSLVDANPNLRVIFKHYPLSTTCNPNMHSNMHEHACAAAYAAACANKYGQFRAMADFLFVYPYMAVNLHDLSQASKIDEATLGSCISSPDVAAEVSQDLLDGVAAGVKGTPTLLYYQSNTWVELSPSLTAIQAAIPSLKIP